MTNEPEFDCLELLRESNVLILFFLELPLLF